MDFPSQPHQGLRLIPRSLISLRDVIRFSIDKYSLGEFILEWEFSVLSKKANASGHRGVLGDDERLACT